MRKSVKYLDGSKITNQQEFWQQFTTLFALDNYDSDIPGGWGRNLDALYDVVCELDNFQNKVLIWKQYAILQQNLGQEFCCQVLEVLDDAIAQRQEQLGQFWFVYYLD